MKSLFINPQGNYTLALYTAIENFATVSMESEISDPLKTEEYKILDAVLRDFLKDKILENGLYQFKIQVESLATKDDVILSPELSLDPGL